MTLASDLGLTVAAELAVGGAEIVAVGHDPELQEIAIDYEAGIAARAERGDLVVAVELLADAVAKRVCGLFQNSSSRIATSLVWSACS